jgi:hypothetical protein
MLVAAVGIALLIGGCARPHAGPPAATPPAGASGVGDATAPVPPTAAAPADDLAPPPVIRTGPGSGRQRVHFAGDILIDARGQHACPPYPVPAVATGVSPRGATPPPDCPVPWPVSGVDPALLTERRSATGWTFGKGDFDADFDGERLTVVAQRPWTGAAPDRGSVALHAPTPCAAPRGGWTPGEQPSSTKVQALVDGHPQDWGAVAISYPVAPGSDVTATSDAVNVLLVGTTRDIPTATASIRAVYGGNLCVVRAQRSAADVGRASSYLRPDAMPDPGFLTGGVGQYPDGDPVVTMSVVVWNQAWQDQWVRAGEPAILLDCWLLPG